MSHSSLALQSHDTFARSSVNDFTQLSELLACCCDAVEKASAIIRSIHADRLAGGSGTLGAALKDATCDRSWATIADTRAQAIIVNLLHQWFPNVGVVGEEGTDDDAEPDSPFPLRKSHPASDSISIPARFRTVPSCSITVFVDPLDGTKEFVEGRVENVCILVGIAIRGEAVAGVIGLPFWHRRGNTIEVRAVKPQFMDSIDADDNPLTRTGPSMEDADVVLCGVIGGTTGHIGGLPPGDAYRADERREEIAKHFAEKKPIKLRLAASAEGAAGSAVAEARAALTRPAAAGDAPAAAFSCAPDLELVPLPGAGNKIVSLLLGRCDVALLNLKGSLWDTCATEALLVASGGCLTDYFGARLHHCPMNSLGLANKLGVLATSCKAIDHGAYCRRLSGTPAVIKLLERTGMIPFVPPHATANENSVVVASDVARTLHGAPITVQMLTMALLCCYDPACRKLFLHPTVSSPSSTTLPNANGQLLQCHHRRRRRLSDQPQSNSEVSDSISDADDEILACPVLVSSFFAPEDSCVRYKMAECCRLWLRYTRNPKRSRGGDDEEAAERRSEALLAKLPRSIFIKRSSMRDLSHARAKMVSAPHKLARDIRSYAVETAFLRSEACARIGVAPDAPFGTTNPAHQFQQPGHAEDGDAKREREHVSVRLARAVWSDALVEETLIDSSFCVLLQDFCHMDGWKQKGVLTFEELKATLSTLARFHAFFWNGRIGTTPPPEHISHFEELSSHASLGTRSSLVGREPQVGGTGDDLPHPHRHRHGETVPRRRLSHVNAKDSSGGDALLVSFGDRGHKSQHPQLEDHHRKRQQQGRQQQQHPPESTHKSRRPSGGGDSSADEEQNAKMFLELDRAVWDSGCYWSPKRQNPDQIDNLQERFDTHQYAKNFAPYVQALAAETNGAASTATTAKNTTTSRQPNFSVDALASIAPRLKHHAREVARECHLYLKERIVGQQPFNAPLEDDIVSTDPVTNAEIQTSRSQAHPQRTLIHGDLKAANIFCRTKEGSSSCASSSSSPTPSAKDIEVGLIDFQWTGWGIPAVDIAYLMCAAAGPKVLDLTPEARAETELLQHYHKELCNALATVGASKSPEEAVATKIPFDVLRKQYEAAVLDHSVTVFSYLWNDIKATPETIRERGIKFAHAANAVNKNVDCAAWLLGRSLMLLDKRDAIEAGQDRVLHNNMRQNMLLFFDTSNLGGNASASSSMEEFASGIETQTPTD